MAQQTFSCVLNAASFPFLSDFAPRTVIIPALDNTVRNPISYTGTTDSQDIKLPQVIYCHNVFPTGEGLMSVGFESKLAGISGADDFDQAITLRDEDENTFLYSPANGKNYIYTANNAEWISVDPITDFTGRQVTRAYVNGRTFICYEKYGIFEFDREAETFTQVSTTYINQEEIICITASNNYLVACSATTVYWSSLIDVLDFEPSFETGAANLIPQDIKAAIVAVHQMPGGFIIYTAKNAVSAVYSSNAKAPFIFKEISNSGGVTSPEHVTSDSTLGAQYAWTTGGLQKLTSNTAEVLFPECTDFLAGFVFEDFTTSLVKTTLTSPLSVKLSYISSRYLVISYGITQGNYTHALVYDTALKRWGKLKVTHVDCFLYPYPNLIGPLTYDDLAGVSYDELEDTTYDELEISQTTSIPPKRGMAFLKSDGSVELAVFDYREFTDTSVLILGKYQLTRSSKTCLQEVALESPSENNSLSLQILPSIDGKTLGAAVTPAINNFKSSLKVRVYNKRVVAENYSLLITGSFELSCILMTVTKHATR